MRRKKGNQLTQFAAQLMLSEKEGEAEDGLRDQCVDSVLPL